MQQHRPTNFLSSLADSDSDLQDSSLWDFWQPCYLLPPRDLKDTQKDLKLPYASNTSLYRQMLHIIYVVVWCCMGVPILCRWEITNQELVAGHFHPILAISLDLPQFRIKIWEDFQHIRSEGSKISLLNHVRPDQIFGQMSTYDYCKCNGLVRSEMTLLRGFFIDACEPSTTWLLSKT